MLNSVQTNYPIQYVYIYIHINVVTDSFLVLSHYLISRCVVHQQETVSLVFGGHVHQEFGEIGRSADPEEV